MWYRRRGFPLHREAGKVTEKPDGVVAVVQFGLGQRATPHPALRATFPSKLGKDLLAIVKANERVRKPARV